MQVDDLILTKSLGKGSFGEVFLTQKKGSNELYATKRLDRAFQEKKENMKRLTNEITILKNINPPHPNIVRLIDLKKTKTHIYIVTEFCNGGSLSKCLQKYTSIHFKPFNEEIVQYLMRQIVNAIYFLHKHKVIHRDLKLDNILVNFPTEKDKKSLNMMKATVKLIDFGFATRLHSSKSNLTYTVLGTPCNMEPHLLNNMEMRTHNKQGYDEKADIWSLGTLCYEMLEGHMTFSGRSLEELYKKVKDGNYSLPLSSSKEAVSFINGMLQYDPNKRLSAEELLNHDFLVKSVNNFHSIDISKVQNKISGNAMNINVKDNQSIWAVFNKDNKNQINNNKIPQNNVQIQQKQINILPQNYNQLNFAKVIRMPNNNKQNYQIPVPNHHYQQQGMYTIPEVSQEMGQEPYMINQGLKGNNQQIAVQKFY